jgi:hypothetical protein
MGIEGAHGAALALGLSIMRALKGRLRRSATKSSPDDNVPNLHPAHRNVFQICSRNGVLALIVAEDE